MDNLNKNVLIIGGGVSGLTTAYCLVDAGYKVTVISKDFAPNITSNVAGALWEWPPAVCGYHSDEVSLDRSKDWCMTSYHKFYELENIEDNGVYIKDVFFFFREKVLDNTFQTMKMNELKDKVNGFRHTEDLIKEEGVNNNIGLVDAYCHAAPMVNTDVYMEWLKDECKNRGVKILQREIKNRLIHIEQELKEQYHCSYIINCTGLGSRLLAGEYMYPLRGALVRIKNLGNTHPILDKAYCISFDEKTREQDIVFIVPRGKDRIILGALAEENEWNKEVNLNNHKPILQMFERCKEFLPYLKDAELDEKEPVRIGLRPFRRGNVRLEWEADSNIIHNYGHGGAGVTFSWGCSEEIVKMINLRNNLA